MQRTFDYGVSNRVSPATVELLICERSKGKSLRQLGQMFGKSHEKARQLLAKHDRLQITLLPEGGVATKLGYKVGWLVRLRKQGIINPVKPGGFWLYSEEQVRQIPSLIAEMRRCEQCGKPRPLGSQRFCRECNQNRRKHYYEYLSPEAKANPERSKIRSRAKRKYRAKAKGSNRASDIPPPIKPTVEGDNE